MRKSKSRLLALAVASAAMVMAAGAVVAAIGAGGGLWRVAGQNVHNTRHQASENKIGPANVADLQVKWSFQTGGDVSATPAVDGNSVYVPDWAGNLYRINKKTGDLVWSRTIASYTGIPSPGQFSRVTPAVQGGMLIFGDQGGRVLAGARVMAVNKKTGDLIWSTKVDDHFASIITQSAVVLANVAYVGVSSLEESFSALIPGYQCCSFRGSVVALDVKTGEVLWKTYTAPPAPPPGDPAFPGFSGNAVWGSTPVVDTKRNSLYVTTGNNYSVPQDVLDCVGAADPDDAAAIRECFMAFPDNAFDAFVALDLKTGEVKWRNTVIPFDAWVVACFGDLPGFPPFNDNCPDPAGPDHDFGQGPALFTVTGPDGRPRDLLGAGQKSGQYWALDPDTGETVWVTQVGPGGEAGGHQWGSATDGRRIYTAITNSNFTPWVLPGGGIAIGGLWSALDPASGEILWQTATPGLLANGAPALAMGPVTVANGVVYAGSLDAPGTMNALDAETGAILWTFESGGSVNSAPAIDNGTVYWGSGYSTFAILGATGNDRLYAFELPMGSQ